MKHLLGLTVICSLFSLTSFAQQPAKDVAVAGFLPTNLTVYTEDGLMYMAAIHYDSISENKPYLFNAATEGYPVKQVINGRQEQTMQDVKNLAASLTLSKPHLHHPSVKVAKTKLSLANLWIKDDLLYFQLHLDNPSPIPYDIAITKYYERDNTKAKRTTVVEKEVTPYYERFNETRRIASGAAENFIIVFPKFTIADSKHFAIELFEKDGDRHLVLNIKGKKILAASSLP